MPEKDVEVKKLVLIIMCIGTISCALNRSEHIVKKVAPWDVLDNAVESSWTMDTVIKKMGTPSKIQKEGLNEIWFYYDKLTGYQDWAFGFDKNKVKSVSFLPHGVTAMEEVEKHWSHLKCEHKKELELIAGHHYSPKTYMVCDSGHRIMNYNQYREVHSIMIK